MKRTGISVVSYRAGIADQALGPVAAPATAVAHLLLRLENVVELAAGAVAEESPVRVEVVAAEPAPWSSHKQNANACNTQNTGRFDAFTLSAQSYASFHWADSPFHYLLRFTGFPVPLSEIV